MALPIKPVRTLRFTTDEATWISLDVSPDGKTIVFDILGDLYTIPIAGGTATRLTTWCAMGLHAALEPGRAHHRLHLGSRRR
jgi:hypothetical protein